MSFDESLFSFFYKRRKRKQVEVFEQRKIDHQAVELKGIEEQLSFFASAVFLAPMEIRSTNGIAYQSSNKLFLPAFVAANPDKEKNSLFYRILILHLYGSYLYFKDNPEHEVLKGDFESLQSVYSKKDLIQEQLSTIYPNYPGLFCELSESWGGSDMKFMSAEDFKILNTQEFGFSSWGIWGGYPRETTIISGGSDEVDMRQALPDAKTEMVNKKSHQVNKLNLDENKENIGQDVFSHFEKLETLEEFSGVQREMDGEDELETHGDALDELNLQEVIRTGKATQIGRAHV